jgi:hypothetical protein
MIVVMSRSRQRNVVHLSPRLSSPVVTPFHVLSWLTYPGARAASDALPLRIGQRVATHRSGAVGKHGGEYDDAHEGHETSSRR